MAKRRKRRTYTRARASPKRTYRRRRSSTVSKATPFMYGLYGAGRGYISQYAAKIPVIGGLGDEAAMLAVTYAGKKWGSGTIKKVATAGYNIEWYNLGRAFSAGGLGGLFGGASAGGVTVA